MDNPALPLPIIPIALTKACSRRATRGERFMMTQEKESIKNTNNGVKLSIFGTLKNVVNGLTEKIKKLATYMAFPVISLILLPFFISYLVNNFLENNRSLPFSMFIFYWLFYCYLYLNIAVVTHRIFLDDTSLRIYHGIIWNFRHIRFLFKLIIFFIAAIFVYFLTAMLIAFTTPFIKPSIENQQNSDYFIVLCLSFIFWVPAQYLLARWSLILPAAAIGKNLNTGDSYKITNGNGFRLVILITFIPTLIASLLGSPALTEDVSIFLSNLPGYEIWGTIIVQIFGAVFFIFEISLLSMCYSFFFNQKRNP